MSIMYVCMFSIHSSIQVVSNSSAINDAQTQQRHKVSMCTISVISDSTNKVDFAGRPVPVGISICCVPK